MTHLSISVIIATKGRLSRVCACINSILKQTLLPQQIIIVDSSKSTILNSILKTNFSIAYPKIKYIHSDVCLTAARNLGVKHTTGDIVFFFDDDVILDKDYIKEVIKVFRNDTDGSIAGVMGKITNIRTRMNTLNTTFRRLFFLGYFGNGRLTPSGIATSVQHMNKNAKTSCLSGCGMVYRRKVFREFSFDENLGKHSGYCYREDVDFSYRVSRKYVLVYTPFAKLQHLEVKTARANPILIKRQQIFNFHYLFKKNMPKHLTNFVAFCLSVIGILLLSIAQKNARETAGILRGVLDIISNYK